MPTRTFGIVGFGRFGRAFGTLLEESGYDVRAFDALVPVDSAHAAGSLEELAAGSGTLVVAVPVAEIGGALDGLAPFLAPRHLVFDVGSVKCGPTELLRTRLGTRVPWVATHPLFGPTSLALGERPLRAVVCPNADHPAAFDGVCRLFEQLGCQVLALDPDVHDRAMADSHALAYFIAKALLDTGATMDSDLAPPSAKALARTIASVRSDAGHLLLTLHRENPFSGESRRRFLEALHDLDHALRHGAAVPGATPPPELAIPDLGAASPALREVRDLIDDVDREIVELLARRAQLARRARAAKAGLGHAVRDPRREEELLKVRRDRAEALGLDPVSVETIFEEILRFSRRLQHEPEKQP